MSGLVSVAVSCVDGARLGCEGQITHLVSVRLGWSDCDGRVDESVAGLAGTATRDWQGSAATVCSLALQVRFGAAPDGGSAGRMQWS